jgi:hypothetical protein
MDKEWRGKMGRRRKKGAVKVIGVSATEGARRASAVVDTAAAEGGGPLGPGQRWSARRKREVVLRMLRGESLEALSRELGVEIYRLEQWRERALTGLEVLLKDREEDHPMRTELDAAKRHIGELSMENELLRARCRAMEARDPLALGRWRK